MSPEEYEILFGEVLPEAKSDEVPAPIDDALASDPPPTIDLDKPPVLQFRITPAEVEPDPAWLWRRRPPRRRRTLPFMQRSM